MRARHRVQLLVSALAALLAVPAFPAAPAAAAAATHFQVAAVSPQTVGTSFTVTVTALDANGDIDTGYREAVAITSSDPAATLPGSYTFKVPDRGVHVFTVALNTVGTHSITATDVVNPSIIGTRAGIVVTKATQTIAFGSLANRTFDQPAVTVSATASSGLPVTFSSLTTAVCTTGGTTGATVTSVAVGTCTIRASQAGDASFEPAADVEQSFTINPGNQTIDFPQPTPRTYGDPPFDVSATASSGLPVAFSSLTAGVCTVSVTTVTLIAAGDCTIRASQAGDASWNAATPVDRTVTKATQAIAFGSLANRTFDQTSTTVSATASSGLPVSFTSLTMDVCTTGGADGASVTFVAVGTCTIRASQAGDASFEPAPDVEQSFTINPGNQTITFPQPAARTYGDPPFDVTATGGGSGNPVTFSSPTPGVCTVGGTTVTIVGAGDCTVRASQAGDANWNAATPVDRTVTVAKAPQTITFPQPAARTYGDEPFLIGATGGGSGNPVTFSSTTPGVCTVGGTTVTIVGAGDCTVQASQAGDTNWSAATPVSRTVAVSRATPGISVTGGSFPFTGSPHAGSGFAYGLGGIGDVLVPAVTLSYSGTGSTIYGPSAAAPTAGGEYRVTAVFAGNANYLGGSAFAPLTIGRAPQAITFGALANRTYGDSPFTVSTTGGGSGNPVILSTLTTSVCTVSGATVTIVGAGTCTIDADQAGDGSYSAAPQAHATVVVAKANLSVIAVDKVITFGSADPPFTFAYAGLVGNDGAGDIDTPPTCAVGVPHANVVGSPYPIACSGGVDDDYTFSYVNGALTVAPAAQAALSVVVSSPATYGTTLSLTTVGGTGSGAVTYSAGASTACSVAGTTLSITSGTGTCAVTATKAADANHSPISSVASVTVTRAAPTISLTASVDTYEANVPVTFTASVQGIATGATPTGIVTFSVTGLADAARALAAGGATDTLTFATVGPKVVLSDFAGDANYLPATASIAPTVVANVVSASGVGASGSTIYPVKDTWKDTVAIRGTRNERISVAIAVYSPTGSRVRSTSLPAGTGAYSYAWNGRSSSGTILAAGRYRVVQVLSDAYGARRTYISYVTLSRKRMSWYTKVITVSAGPRNYQVRSTSDARFLSAPSTTSSGSLVMSNSSTAPAWVAAGYQFTLPSASIYRSLSFEVKGAWTGTTPPKIGLIPWSGGDWGSVYSLVRPRAALGTSPTTFYRHAVTDLAGIRSGRTVRAAIDSFAAPGGHAVGPYRYAITTVRLVVRYGILE